MHEVRQFVGLAAYYRRYVKDFAKISVPLFDLIKTDDPEARKKKHRTIRWTYQCASAFDRLKKLLMSRPILMNERANQPVRIQTDASDYAIGFEISQQDEKGDWRPITFDGRKLQGAEINYPTHEKELLAAKHAIRTYPWLVDGQETTIITDHNSLQYMNTMKSQSRRIARWVDEFQAYTISFKYRKGKEAVVPDALSRHPLFKEGREVPKFPGRLNAVRQNRRRQPENRQTPDKNTATTVPTGQTTTENTATSPDGGEENREIREAHLMQGLRETLQGKPLSIPQDMRRTISARRAKKFWLDPEDDSLRKKAHNFPENGPDDLKRAYSAPFIAAAVRADFTKKTHDRYGHIAWPGLSGIVETLG